MKWIIEYGPRPPHMRAGQPSRSYVISVFVEVDGILDPIQLSNQVGVTARHFYAIKAAAERREDVEFRRES